MKDKQLKIAEKHRAVLILIYKISNQLINQDQLTKILIESKYCTNKIAVSRLLKLLEDNKLIKRSRLKRERHKVVQICKPAIRIIKNKDSKQVATIKHTIGTGHARSCRNGFMTEFFYQNYIKNTDLTLIKALQHCINSDFSINLYKSSQNFYNILDKKYKEVLQDSFSTQSTYFQQLNTIKESRRYNRELFKYKTQGGVEPKEYIAKVLTLDDLKNRQIYLTNAKVTRNKDENEFYQKNCPQLTPLTLKLKFIHFIYAAQPRVINIKRQYNFFQKFIEKSFVLRYSDDFKREETERAFVHIEVDFEVIFLNEIAFNEINDKIFREIEKETVMIGNTITFNFNIKQYNINRFNEHLF